MSTPASVIGTSAKDLLGSEYRRRTVPVPLQETQTHLDGIEEGGHLRAGVFEDE